VKDRRNSSKRDEETLESKVMILPKSCVSTLKRNENKAPVEFQISGYSKPYYLDTGVALGFQYADLMEVLRSHLSIRLKIADQVSREWLRLRVRHKVEVVAKTAGDLYEMEWNYVDSTIFPFFEIKEIQNWVTDGEKLELGESSLGEAVLIYLAKVNGGVFISNDMRALEVSSQIGVISGHQGHLLRQLVHYRLVNAGEAFEKFLKMCWISGVNREFKRKIRSNWFYEADPES